VPSPLTDLAELVSRPLFHTARVTTVEDVTPRVRLISLAAGWARPGSWRPGDKVQVRMTGLSTRTYTPVVVDDAGDGFGLVAFVHGDGPGARWVRGLDVADEVAVFGPRRSLDCSSLTGPVVLVGDETAVGLAAAVAGVAGVDLWCAFEATEPDDVRAPAERLGLAVDHVVARTEGGAHRDGLAAEVAERIGVGDTTLVASGDAATVAAVRRHLKDQGMRPDRTLAKAYWAEGRRGLD
jgi:ferric-chelate reductase (NADPH)